MDKQREAKENLVRALAETHLECISAEHDYGRLLHDGCGFANSKYGPQHLEQNPEDLDNWSFQTAAMREAQERGGLGEIPSLPYHPVPITPK